MFIKNFRLMLVCLSLLSLSSISYGASNTKVWDFDVNLDPSPMQRSDFTFEVTDFSGKCGKESEVNLIYEDKTIASLNNLGEKAFFNEHNKPISISMKARGCSSQDTAYVTIDLTSQDSDNQTIKHGELVLGQQKQGSSWARQTAVSSMPGTDYELWAEKDGKEILLTTAQIPGLSGIFCRLVYISTVPNFRAVECDISLSSLSLDDLEYSVDNILGHYQLSSTYTFDQMPIFVQSTGGKGGKGGVDNYWEANLTHQDGGDAGYSELVTYGEALRNIDPEGVINILYGLNGDNGLSTQSEKQGTGGAGGSSTMIWMGNNQNPKHNNTLLIAAGGGGGQYNKSSSSSSSKGSNGSVIFAFQTIAEKAYGQDYNLKKDEFVHRSYSNEEIYYLSSEGNEVIDKDEIKECDESTDCITGKQTGYYAANNPERMNRISIGGKGGGNRYDLTGSTDNNTKWAKTGWSNSGDFDESLNDYFNDYFDEGRGAGYPQNTSGSGGGGYGGGGSSAGGKAGGSYRINIDFYRDVSAQEVDFIHELRGDYKDMDNRAVKMTFLIELF
ncbi:hypothetical protein [uncultured Shewanella sp.]|uniref:hypothetical protein n=1 Tax=uncultured Shewanella sp. TaxID=173975 RepID=UPI0026318A49|nr:hypothetical protein [uncultured Shewanella sp.]